ncbi:MAG TPA: hypothetical protein ENI74_01975 [Gammaproteobacteria bacterium]|nr:hypothetical protein [Gammaproteobacteria bacterium]
MPRLITSIAIIPIAILFLTACAPGPKQYSIRLTETPYLQTSPSKSVVVNIRNVTDSREFIPSGDNPDLPQLATAEKIDPVVISTATAQVRNAFGDVIYDLFTEKKIIAIVKSAIEESFRRAGYTVSNAATNATPVDVNIIRFWAYNTGGLVTFQFYFDISVEMTGDLPVLRKQKKYYSSIKLKSAFGAGSRSFENTINKGMDKFIRELAAQLLE